MKEKLTILGSIIMGVVFVGLILWASVIDPIIEKAEEIGTVSSLVRYIVIAIIIIIAIGAEGAIMHDDRIQDPYKSILGFAIFGLVALAGWYFKTRFGW